jgi:hypothetical protein
MSKRKGKRLYWPPVSKRLKKPLSVAATVRAYSVVEQTRTGSSPAPTKFVVQIPRVNSRSPGPDLPNWRAKIQQHYSVTTSFDATKFWWSAKAYRGRVVLTSNPATWGLGTLVSSVRHGTGDGLSMSSDCPTTPPSFSGSSFTTANNLAVQRLYDTIREMESHVKTGETIGEYHQTINLFKRGLGGMRDLMNHIIRNHEHILDKGMQWRNAKRVAKSLADLTLEYRFGIEPLAKVLGEAAGAIQRDSYMEAFLPFSVSGKANSTVIEYDTTWDSFPSLHVYTFRKREHKVRFKGEYRIKSAEDGPSYARSLGLTWRELVPTLYNLIPYSFVLDYVSNLHTFVEVLAVPFSQVAWCVRTDRASEVNHRSYDFRQKDQNAIYALTENAPGYCDLGASGVRRRDQTSLPLPILQWKKPSERALENLMALVASRLPIIGQKTKRLLRSPSGKTLDNEFRLATRARIHKVPYPFHSA